MFTSLKSHRHDCTGDQPHNQNAQARIAEASVVAKDEILDPFANGSKITTRACETILGYAAALLCKVDLEPSCFPDATQGLQL